jgi:hypothetical protein
MDSHAPQSAFPATELAAAGPSGTGFSGADLSAAAPADIEPDLTAQSGPSHPSAGPGAEHPPSAETDHATASWWEKLPPGPA